MMDRTVVRKTSFREAEDAACPGLTPAERLSVLAELNRVELNAEVGRAVERGRDVDITEKDCFQSSRADYYANGGFGGSIKDFFFGDSKNDTSDVHYCPHCGYPIVDDFDYCPKCGKPLK